MAELLVVDDDERLAELCAWFLAASGHEVRTARSYREARERIAELPPQLMLADLDLGAESGRVELARLAAEGLLPPTLVVSGYLDGALDAELAAIDGVRGTLAKPFDPPDLAARVERCLGEQSGARA
ncbi:MAG: response regulator [Planctomycetota bacterium]|jgi:DNA-binding response OmpR family regulator|nr:response regulator [Planctomycetota bacterium]MDP6762191.1 response regulator [Planctomycetota bacterium]MDP6990079.1 response regulator [Planctomycetota bacterium]